MELTTIAGAETRERMLLDAKNHWADRARQAEADRDAFKGRWERAEAEITLLRNTIKTAPQHDHGYYGRHHCSLCAVLKSPATRETP